MNRDELIDFLLGELPEERSSAVAERLGLDDHAASEHVRYSEALVILRAAASDASWAPISGSQASGSQASGSQATGSQATTRSGGRVLLLRRTKFAAAAVLLLAAGLFFANRNGVPPPRVFEPEAALGALLPEELGADGVAIPGAGGAGYVLRDGSVTVSSLGAEATHDLEPGAEISENTEITCAAEGGARIDLPRGGLLYLRPLSTVQLRSRRDGQVALRLLSGDAATVARDAPIHISVDGTDLLLTQSDGAALVRHQPGEAICLRGKLELHVENGTLWRIPAGERLPATCARAPESGPAHVEDLQLDWYLLLQYGEAVLRNIVWEREGLSEPIDASALSETETLLYLRVEPTHDGEFLVRVGDGPGRRFPLVRGRRFELRVPLSTLGRGSRLEVSPGFNVTQARLLTLD